VLMELSLTGNENGHKREDDPVCASLCGNDQLRKNRDKYKPTKETFVEEHEGLLILIRGTSSSQACSERAPLLFLPSMQL
jgi:hypothetical protein